MHRSELKVIVKTLYDECNYTVYKAGYNPKIINYYSLSVRVFICS